MSQLLAQVFRNQRVESQHRGHLAVVDAAGQLLAYSGNPEFATYIRSSAKPFQIMPLLEDGVDVHFGLDGPELAVAIASHNGEDRHVQAVQSLMQKVGLREEQLQCAFHRPLHKPSARKWLLEQRPRSPVYNNCSGKHAGMLAVATFHGWPLATYLQPEHPLQRRILATVARFSDVPEAHIGVGVDGCSAPVFYLPVRNMALMYARLAKGELGVSRRVFELMTTYPEMIAGSERFDTDLMQATKGRLVSKIGAEGIRCVGVRGDRPVGLALKIEDGTKRASEAVMLEALVQLNLITQSERRQLEAYRRPVIKNHAGLKVGWIAPSFKLTRRR